MYWVTKYGDNSPGENSLLKMAGVWVVMGAEWLNTQNAQHGALCLCEG